MYKTAIKILFKGLKLQTLKRAYHNKNTYGGLYSSRKYLLTDFLNKNAYMQLLICIGKLLNNKGSKNEAPNV